MTGMPGTEVLLQYGAIGVFSIFAAVAVRVMFKSLQAAWDREKTRADRLENELRSLNEAIRTEYIGKLTQASQAISDANRATADVLAARKQG